MKSNRKIPNVKQQRELYRPIFLSKFPYMARVSPIKQDMHLDKYIADNHYVPKEDSLSRFTLILKCYYEGGCIPVPETKIREIFLKEGFSPTTTRNYLIELKAGRKQIEYQYNESSYKGKRTPNIKKKYVDACEDLITLFTNSRQSKELELVKKDHDILKNS